LQHKKRCSPFLDVPFFFILSLLQCGHVTGANTMIISPYLCLNKTIVSWFLSVFNAFRPLPNIANMAPFPVTIKAGNYIDADGQTELLIPAGSPVKKAKIYTSRPKFTISADYPVSSLKVEWEMGDNTINAIIK
jgi:hypothetical protein